MSDSLDSHIFTEIIQISLGCSYCCDTGTREADLGCRSKLINNIRISCFCTLFENFKKEILLLLIVIEMMYTVSIIPVDTEIRCSRLQTGKTFNCVLWVSISLWIGIFRNTPDTLDCRIFTYQFLNHIHIWSLRSHRNIDHLNSKELCNLKMAVISRNRAEEFYLIQLAPWCISHNTMCHRTCHSIKHNVQTGSTINDDVFRWYLRNLSKKTLCLRNTIHNSIVTTIYPCFTFQICAAWQNIHQFHRKIQLICCRFTTWHIQGKSLCFDICILLIQFFLQIQQLFSAHFAVLLHNCPPRAGPQNPVPA